MYVFFFFLIYLFIRVFSFQEKHPKYHPYSIISEGQQIDGSINPHEIFVYQINSVEQSLEFLFRADDNESSFLFIPHRRHRRTSHNGASAHSNVNIFPIKRTSDHK